MDKHHGQGGSYEFDPLSKERRLVKGTTTEPTDTGGPRDSEGKQIVEKKAEKPQPAIPEAPKRAPWETEATAAPAEPKRTKGA